MCVSCWSTSARAAGAGEHQVCSLQIDKDSLLKKHSEHLGPQILCVIQDKVMLNLSGNVHRKFCHILMQLSWVSEAPIF